MPADLRDTEGLTQAQIDRAHGGAETKQPDGLKRPRALGAANALVVGRDPCAAVGNSQWPDEREVTVAIAVLVIGVAYPIGSEYVNVVVRRSWSYTE